MPVKPDEETCCKQRPAVYPVAASGCCHYKITDYLTVFLEMDTLSNPHGTKTFR